jgi:hypothetical protein
MRLDHATVSCARRPWQAQTQPCGRLLDTPHLQVGLSGLGLGYWPRSTHQSATSCLWLAVPPMQHRQARHTTAKQRPRGSKGQLARCAGSRQTSCAPPRITPPASRVCSGKDSAVVPRLSPCRLHCPAFAAGASPRAPGPLGGSSRCVYMGVSVTCSDCSIGRL